jgi:hypothetical protein
MTGRLWPQYYQATIALDVNGELKAGPHETSQREASPREAAPPRDILSYECYLESLNEWEAANLPSSPSGIALRAIREGRIRVRFPRTKSQRK